MSATKESLEKFVTYCQQYIKGDEKGEAQIFLDRFFQAFGHEGALEAGAIYEERIKKVSKAGRTGFADLVWKPRVLIEMKKRGEVLTRHWRQTFDYWTYLVPNRPRYVIICNFDEFWMYDFNLQVDTPVDIVLLTELPERLSAFTFMELSNRTPVFQNNQVEVTERAAKRMGLLFKTLQQRGKKKNLFDDMTAQRFVLQCVLAMFAEDRQLLPRDLFLTCIEDCVNGGSSYDILGGLFHAMNNPQTIPAGRYEGVEYFNGGLFSIIQPPNMRQALSGLSCYFAIPKIVKYIMFQPVDITILPCEANMVIASDDFYILGILNSRIHRIWVKAQCSTLEDRTRYTNTTCFETFPFPQIVTKKLVTQIRQQMTKLHQYRIEQMQEKQWGITDLYNEFFDQPQSKLSKFHKKLDELVILAYGFTADDDWLEKLWLLNQELANKEAAGENIIGPWSPSI